MSDLQKIGIDLIDPDPDQPRKRFVEIEDLARSLETHGLLEPITVTPDGDRFKVLFGERRMRAAKHLEWAEISAVVETASLTPSERLERQTAENEDRDNLTLAERMTARLRAWQLSGVEGLREYCDTIGRPPAYLARYSTALNHLSAQPDDSPSLRSLREEATAATQDGRLKDAECVPLLFKVPEKRALHLLRNASTDAPVSRLALKELRQKAEEKKRSKGEDGPAFKIFRLPEDLLREIFRRLDIAYDPELPPADQIQAHFALESR